MTQYNSPTEIERGLAIWRNAKLSDPELSVPPTFERNSDFKNEEREAGYLSYLNSAEHNYAIARLHFALHIEAYAFFCSQQAIETYLKAYARVLGLDVPQTHRLVELLIHCRNSAPSESFVASEYAETIAELFDPFNEWARYPVLRTRPKGRVMVCMHPFHMHILDYFVFRMRDLLPVPPSHKSLFRGGIVPLMNFQREHKDIYSLITTDNINFESLTLKGDGAT